MEHSTQLPICKLALSIMNEKLDTIIEAQREIKKDISDLTITKVEQSAINREVLRAIEDLNRKQEEQEEVMKSLSLFVWIGENWGAFIASIVGLVGLLVAYLSLKK